ncbi:MAG TPA: hypothetical protein VM582_03100 [Candidatus Thermoplasmatota archaeon]|nr:hypothetical protein [Candidatus Thermoplasmatota archaeon]
MRSVQEGGGEASPRAMLAQIEAAGRIDSSIRARTEGVTWVIWGLAFAGYGLTLSTALALEGAGLGIFWGLAILAWQAVAIAASVGIWRSVGLPFRTDVSARRATLFFIGWWLLFGVAERVFHAVVPAGREHAATLAAFGALLLVFAAANPLRFTPLGRRTGLVLAIVALAASGIGLALAAGPLAFAYVSGVLGISWTLAGLYALYRG